jgi:peptidoglycan/xylan/chitin deacetylase (PgdA/CDA1 family)
MGTVVISVDAALGWDVHYRDRLPDRLATARDGWAFLADILDTYDLPATWAVAGHLLLEECNGRHEDHPLGPAWFERERTTWADRPDLRFADGLVERLRESDPDHDIGCLGFSGVDFGDPETTARTARAELAAASRAAQRRGIEFDSFVFPNDSVGHREELAAADFECYRGVVPSRRGRHRKLLDAMVGSSAPRLVTPAVDDWGLVNVPASLDLFSFDGLTRWLLEPAVGDPIVSHVETGIAELADSDRVFHLRLQPSSVRRDPDRRRVRQVCEAIRDRRDDVEVATMADVAARATQPSVRHTAGEPS